MSESTKSKTTQKEHIFENDFVFVSADGEVKLKKTALFDERTLTTVDSESAKSQVKALEKAFENLEAKAEALLIEFEDLTTDGIDEAASKLDGFLKEFSDVNAIGDFERLAELTKKKFEALKEKINTSTEEDPSSRDNNETESAEEHYKNLVKKAEELKDISDWAYVSMEFDNIDLKWNEGEEVEGLNLKPLRKKIDDLRAQFEEKKKAHYEEQKRIRLENLEKKKKLLASLKDIVDNKQWTKTKDVGKLKGRWENIKPVPAEDEEKLNSQFETLLATFDEHKVDRLVKQKQQEEDNLTGKLVILEKMESFVEGLDDESDWNDLEEKFSNLTKQFRKIGRIPSDKNQDVWDRYHSAQDTFHSMRFKHDGKYRDQIEKCLSKKKQLIDEAESLLDSDDLADAARQVNKLHRRWKKVGNLPQKDENEMWDRFKEATDAFNQKKADNADLLHEQEEENYNTKLKLIEKADQLKESDEWEQTHSKFQKLMEEWKNVGPVPKRKSGKIWKKFKGAMDQFYDRRRDHFKEVKEERKDNLKEKEEVLEQLSNLKSHDDPIEAVELAKPLQTEFKKAGYVPIKHKNRLWKEYREVCDAIYDRFRSAKAAVEVVGRENLDQFSKSDIEDIRKKQNELTKLKKTTGKLSSDLIQMKESLSYFKPSGSGSSLLDDVKNRIEKAEEDLNSKEEKISELEREIDMLKSDS